MAGPKNMWEDLVMDFGQSYGYSGTDADAVALKHVGPETRRRLLGLPPNRKLPDYRQQLRTIVTKESGM